MADGRGSKALAAALIASERQVEELRAELEVLQRSQRAVLEPPPIEWLEERIAQLQELLERRTAQAALLIRKLLGEMRLEPVRPTSDGRTTAQPRTWTCWPWWNLTRLWMRSRVRILCNGGGGGSCPEWRARRAEPSG